jgi:hypothetical protein
MKMIFVEMQFDNGRIEIPGRIKQGLKIRIFPLKKPDLRIKIDYWKIPCYI